MRQAAPRAAFLGRRQKRIENRPLPFTPARAPLLHPPRLAWTDSIPIHLLYRPMNLIGLDPPDPSYHIHWPRLSGDGRGSLNTASSLSPSSHSHHSARDLTPAEAYRAAASGVNASGTRAKGGGGGRGDRHSTHAAVGPDMDDSIMRGTGANSVSSAGAGDGDGVAELAKKFR